MFAANTAIVEATAAIELIVERRKSDGEWEKSIEDDDVEILELLEGPNAVHTGEQMRQLHFTYMNPVGESYILIRGLSVEPFQSTRGELPSALDILPAHRVRFELRATKYSESLVKVGADTFDHGDHPRPELRPVQSVQRAINHERVSGGRRSERADEDLEPEPLR